MKEGIIMELIIDMETFQTIILSNKKTEDYNEKSN